MAFNDTTTVILLTNTASQSSQMSLYLTVPTAEDGEAPADIATLSPSLTPPVNSGFVTWEGNQITGNFTSHLGFTTQIQGNAFNQPVNTQVGTAYHAPPFAVPAPGEFNPISSNKFLVSFLFLISSLSIL
jgi:hypothetical protein